MTYLVCCRFLSARYRSCGAPPCHSEEHSDEESFRSFASLRMTGKFCKLSAKSPKFLLSLSQCTEILYSTLVIACLEGFKGEVAMLAGASISKSSPLLTSLGTCGHGPLHLRDLPSMISFPLCSVSFCSTKPWFSVQDKKVPLSVPRRSF